MPDGPVTNDVLLERVNVLCSKVDKVLTCLEGGPSDPGLKVRVDRLEQSESKRTWTFRALVIAVFGLVADFAVGLLRK